ncbi:MAG: type II toxin-antitoxin system RelE family toxin, partial [Thermoplasmata archaeon]
VSRRIFERVGQLSSDPFRSVRRLAGVSAYRLRIGNYRVIFDIDQGRLRVLVLDVGHRKSVYD